MQLLIERSSDREVEEMIERNNVCFSKFVQPECVGFIFKLGQRREPRQ